QQSANFIKPKEQADCSTGYEYGSRQTDADDWRNQVAQNPRVQNIGNQNGLIGVQGNGIQNQIENGNLTQLLIAQKEEAGIQLQVEEYDLMATAADLDEIEEVNANCILMANLQQPTTTQPQ
nr:Gag-Pol polyprotein [Tanacetum cinerariifolium]